MVWDFRGGGGGFGHDYHVEVNIFKFYSVHSLGLLRRWW